MSLKDYHTVSTRSTVSKILENLLISRCGLFFNFKYSFRSSHSTADYLPVVYVIQSLGFPTDVRLEKL